MARVITDITVHPPSDLTGANIPYSGLEWSPKLNPEVLLYIYNISARSFVDPMDPDHKGIIGRINLRAPGLVASDPTEVTLPGGGVDPGLSTQPYHYVTSFPHPMPIPVPNDTNGVIEQKLTDGFRFVVDMISPDNMTRSLDVSIDPSKAWSIGNDYAAKGIFFSTSRPPLQSDLQKAYRRMETYYKGLNERASTLDMTDKLGLQRAIESNPDHIYAANYYGKPFEFAKQAVRPVICPNCGEQKPAGRLFHQTSFQTFCVEPTVEAWRAAVNSGNRHKNQVPDDFKWWKEKPEAGDGSASTT